MFSYIFSFSTTPYRNLHRRLTIFCTCVTQAVILALSILCVFVAEKNIRQGNETSFLTEVTSVLSHLQDQSSISHQWLNQLQENSSIRIWLYDNETPLFYDQYHQSAAEQALCKTALREAEAQTKISAFSSKNKKLTSHTEYQFTTEDGSPYDASVGSIPKGNNYLNFLLLRSLQGSKQQLFSLKIIVVAADLISFFLLFFFFGFFIRKILEPVDAAGRRQSQFIASASHEL